MDTGREQMRPRARVEDIVVQTLPDEVLVYDLKRHKAHCLNPTAALVWKHCDGQTTAAELVHILQQDMRVPVPRRSSGWHYNNCARRDYWRSQAMFQEVRTRSPVGRSCAAWDGRLQFLDCRTLI